MCSQSSKESERRLMETQAQVDPIDKSDFYDRAFDGTSSDDGALSGMSGCRSLRSGPGITTIFSLTPQTPPLLNDNSCSIQGVQKEVVSMSLAEFVERKFLPEFVDVKRSAG